MNRIQKEIEEILIHVKKFGDRAICKYTKRFDKIHIESDKFLLKRNELKKIIKDIDDNLSLSIKRAAKNIELFHRQELKYCHRKWFYSRDGISLSQILNPIEKVGIYVPGGEYSYFSTLLMASIPAKVAGVKKIIVVTPPKNITPEILFAAEISKVDSVYRIGGPMAIAALAYGTKTVPKVDLIVGPGNAYVTEAKRQLYGIVGIDMLAGPSEIVILCDKTADIEYVCCDLIAQVEHGRNSKGYLFCSDVDFLYNVDKLIPRMFRKQIVLLHKSLEKSIQIINELAPEHLEIMHTKTQYILNKIENAGMISIGRYSPVVLGDYFAGPSHILPTDKTARFSSGISVKTFLKHINIIRYSRSSLLKHTDDIVRLANSEGLKFHSKSIKLRKEKGK